MQLIFSKNTESESARIMKYYWKLPLYAKQSNISDCNAQFLIHSKKKHLQTSTRCYKILTIFKEKKLLKNILRTKLFFSDTYKKGKRDL